MTVHAFSEYRQEFFFSGNFIPGFSIQFVFLGGSFCNKLQVPRQIETKAVELLEMPEIRRVAAGRSPTGIAAAVVYLACMLNPTCYRTQRDVAQAAGVTEVTIRNRYNEICDVLGLDRRVLGKQ